MRTRKWAPSLKYLSIGLSLVLGALCAMIYLTPQPLDVEFIQPNLNNVRGLPSTVFHKSYNEKEEGLYWLKFTTEPKVMGLNSLRLKTRSCVHSFSTSQGPWDFPTNLGIACENKSGVLLKNTSESLKQKTTWHIAGSTSGGTYGVILDKNWTEPVLIGLLGLLGCGLFILIFNFMPAAHAGERFALSFILCVAFFIRFLFVFQISLPEMTLFSDMGGYFFRGWEMDRGIFSDQQLFQPVGFTLWSLWLRKIAGFELFNWAQVFLSWGTAVLIFLIARERFGRVTGFIALTLATLHIPQIAMASFHVAETAYAFLITLTLWLLLKSLKNQKLWQFFFLGALLSLAFYFKGNHAFFIPVICLWFLFRNNDTFQNRFKRVTFIALGGLMFLIPHLIWTQVNYGKSSIGPTAGALNFVEGKCPSKDNEDSAGSRWMSPLFSFTNEREYKKWSRPFTDQRYFWQQGLECIQEDPLVLASSFRYIHYLFFGNSLWPVIEGSTFLWYQKWEPLFYFLILPFAYLALLVRARKRDDYQKIETLLLLSLFFTVWFFKSENRFRVPFDALFIGWASYGISWALETTRAFVRKLVKKDFIVPSSDRTEI